MKSWDEQQRRLANWIGKFPRPVGIMTCNDVRRQHLLDVCSQEGVAVPEEVAVIGVDNDDLLCQMCTPPLSSVIPDAETVGSCGAEVVAILEPVIAEAIQFIRENACRGITVEEVTRNVHVSRSTLERNIRQYFSRTPQEEIRQVQIKRVRELLATTDLTTERIAILCGFEHPEYMHVVFKRLTGVTPGEFRGQRRPDKISQ